MLFFFTSDNHKHISLWSCQKVCDAFLFFLDNIFIQFGITLYNNKKKKKKKLVYLRVQIVHLPLIADLFLFCYERDFMLSHSHENQANSIEAFNSTSQNLDDLQNTDNE